VTPAGPGPSFGGEHRPFEWGWCAVGLCFSCLRYSGGGCAGGGVPLGAVPVLSWCGEVSLAGVMQSSSLRLATHTQVQRDERLALAQSSASRSAGERATGGEPQRYRRGSRGLRDELRSSC